MTNQVGSFFPKDGHSATKTELKFYSQNISLLQPKPKTSLRYLKQIIQELHRNYVLVPENKTTNNVVVV